MSSTVPERQNATRLNQIVALEQGVKARAKDALTALYQQFQRGSDAALSGLIRTYQPLNDEDVALPEEKTLVQVRVKDQLEEVGRLLARYLDVTATKDFANTQAKADVRLGDEVFIKDAPVPFLLTLEKELVNVRTMLSKAPTLDLAEKWALDEDAKAYAAEPRETVRSVKVQKVLTLAPATDRHPAQAQLIVEDRPAGKWKTIKLSGALPGAERGEMLERVDRLIAAVKIAREEANQHQVTDAVIGARLVGYLFG
jgi:hypothetical protein